MITEDNKILCVFFIFLPLQMISFQLSLLLKWNKMIKLLYFFELVLIVMLIVSTQHFLFTLYNYDKRTQCFEIYVAFTLY